MRIHGPLAPVLSPEEIVDPDDICPICHLLIYKPVRMRCNHTMYESCMARWADVSISAQMTTVGLDDEATIFLPHEIETRCPMCRTLTSSLPDQARETKLQQAYPPSYQAREAELRGNEEDDMRSTVETLTVYVGNEHNEIRAVEGSNNKHQWKFFVRPSRLDLIEEIQVLLVSLDGFSLAVTRQLVITAPDIPEPYHCPRQTAVPSDEARLGLLHNLRKCHLESRLQLGE